MSKKIRSTEEMIENFKSIHGDKYDYSLFEYLGWQTKSTIICNVHGEFHQLPYSHLTGKGCFKCGRLSSSKKQKENISKSFIENSNLIHNNKYDYSLFEYNGIENLVTIICPIHGEFKQSPHSHLKGHGCRKCATEYITEQVKWDYKELKEHFLNIHNKRYDYPEEYNYIGVEHYIEISCKKHGTFRQKIKHHLNLKGCPGCRKSKGELLIENCLNELNINFVDQYRPDGCINKKTGRVLSFDFYLPDFNCLIEFDGMYHYPIDYLKSINLKYSPNHTFKNYLYTKELDNIKNNFCLENKINILRIPFWNDITKDIMTKDDIFNIIKEYINKL